MSSPLLIFPQTLRPSAQWAIPAAKGFTNIFLAETSSKAPLILPHSKLTRLYASALNSVGLLQPRQSISICSYKRSQCTRRYRIKPTQWKRIARHKVEALAISRLNTASPYTAPDDSQTLRASLLELSEVHSGLFWSSFPSRTSCSSRL